MSRKLGRSEELQQADSKLRSVIEAAGDAFVGMDASGRITDWNRQAALTFGWPTEEVLGRSLAETIIPPQHRAAHAAGLARFLATGNAHILDQRIEITAVDRTGREFPVELTVWAVGEQAESVSFHAFVHDISERRSQEDALRDSEARHRRLADQLAVAQQITGIGSWEWDIPANTLEWSAEMCRIFNVEVDHVPTYESYLALLHPDDRAMVDAAVRQAVATGDAFSFDHRVGLSDSAMRIVHARGDVTLSEDGTPLCLTATAQDVTERRRAAEALRQSERRLATLAMFDDLTGLHNRRGFITLAEQQFKVGRRAGRFLPMLFVDVDGMKPINDTYGHQEGDRALIAVAEFLRSSFRASDVVARIGGDEFCILLVDDAEPSRTDIDQVVAKLRSGPLRPGRPYPLQLSVGVGQLDPDSGASVEDLMVQADGAMYEDKSTLRRQARVLVIEDDAAQRELLELSLQHSYDVVAAATGGAALEAAAQRAPDLVLLDLFLPDMHGTEVLRRLRATPGGGRVPIIVMTVANGRDTELESLRDGVDDFIGKPLDLAILEARIKNVLHRSSARSRRVGADQPS